MFSINKSGNTSSFLDLGNNMQSNCCLTTGLRSEYFYNSSSRNSTKAKCNIKA